MKYLDNLINEITIKQKLEQERKKVNTNPSEKQKESGNYKKGHININGFEITIENPKGSYRKGVDSNGKEWKIKMNNDYGYFLKSIGYDGDHIDVFLGNDFDSKKIFVVDQKINGKFDESKVMLGFKTSNEAKKAYLSNYEKNWKGFHKITEVDEETFKKWLYDGKKQRKAFSEYKDMKLNETVNKIVKNLLIESQESKSQSEAIKLLQQKLGWDYEKANNFVRNDLRSDITSLRDKKIAKFTLGVTRMFVDGQLNNASVISELNTTLKLLLAHLDEYDRNLNNISAQELISKFERTRRDNLESERNEIDSMEFSESDYQIVPINSFEEAQKYYGYTNPNSRWCLTHMGDMFDAYTYGGINQIYFCLRNGFENVEPIVGENAPLDEYGLSMLSIIVNENGELAHCTTRWNHDNGGNDSAMNAKQISEVVGVNFYQTFKPNNKWDELIANVKQQLANGENLVDIFEYVEEMGGGLISVALNGRCNFINQEGKLISDQWFDNCRDFNEGFIAVELREKWNFINQNCEFIGDQWFDYCYDFKNGFANVSLNGKLYYINQEGKLFDKDFNPVNIHENISKKIKSMKINESKIRHIVNETFKKVLLESKKYNSIYDTVFVSYGTDSFSEENFKTPTFDDVINKPRGGFWGSPIDSKYGWGQWSDENDFNIMSLDKHVLFKVKKSSIIYIIDTKEDLDNISKQVSMYDDQKDDMIKTMLAKYNNDMRYYKAIVKAVEDYISKYSTNVIDFDRLVKNYDGIYVTDNAVGKLRHVADGTGLYTWDVESICIFNPNAIEIIPETAFDKTMVPSYEEGAINPYEEDEVDDIFGYSGNRMRNKKQKQINKTYELYGNRNINSDSSNLFNGEHPGILAQGHGNNKKTKLARKYNGTVKSGL